MRTVRKRGIMAGIMAAALVMGSLTLPERVGVLDFGTVSAQAAETVASGTCGENLTWTVDDEGNLTISGTGGMTGYSLYGEQAPWKKYSIVSAVVESGVTTIGYCAFNGCRSLKSIEIPDSVVSIGDCAFYECYGLTSVTLGNGVSSIGYQSFYYCTSLESIDIPESVTSISQLAFDGCTSLNDITMGSNVSHIGAWAFGDTKYWADESNWEDGILYVDNYLVGADDSVFGDSCTIKEETKLIIQYAFIDCGQLTDVYYLGSENEWNNIYNNNDVSLDATIHFAKESYDLGDVNLDGNINYLDAMTVLRYDAELMELVGEQLSVADVNDDGAVNSLDAILILRYDAGLIESF